jgi:hypothetical protein
MNRRIVSTWMRFFSCASANRPSSRDHGVEFASFGLTLARSQTTSFHTVPAVSIVRCSPASRSRRVSSSTPAAAIGSPPVSTMCPHENARTRSTIPSTAISSPSGDHDVYGESHHTQRRLHPLVRTNTLGTPASFPSP